MFTNISLEGDSLFSFIFKIAGLIADEVDKELYSPASIKNQILKLEQSLKEGKITEEEYDEMENELLERLEKSQED
ncbi:gas vesicle protein [Candidatus Parcubacteria bacterium]|nr:MAG: gas vesicle protein [Candidatus Parcubacteria bacterium]